MSSLYSRTADRAAELLGCNDAGLLHYKLHDWLDELVGLARADRITSDEVIALAIQTWEMLNPGEHAVP